MAHYKPKAARMEIVLPLRLTPAQHKTIKQAARQAGDTVSAWLRTTALRAAAAGDA